VVGLSYFTCLFLMMRPFIWYHNLDPLTLEFDLLIKNFNLDCNFWLVGAGAFIFHMCIPSGKTFHLIPWLWPSYCLPWTLTFFSKTLTLVITFDWCVVELHISHMCILSCKTFHLTHAKHILWMLCFIEIFDETKETVPIFETFGCALSDLVSLLVLCGI
jgi:hypothetical protein